MLIDANALASGAHIDSDVCIVGAGAAGITVARVLARHGLRTALLESGGLSADPDTQRLYEVVNLQPKYPFEMMRVRYFGGSTNYWGGTCRPLDEEDFLPRPWVADSGWPIRRADLDPYYPEAMEILDIPASLYATSFDQLAEDTVHNPYLLGPNHAVFEPLVWLQSTPTRMGEKYYEEIRGSSRIQCVLHANATEIVADDSGSRVTGINVRTLAGRALTCQARAYVLCAGGIETARLLLLSDAVVTGGIGNRHDVVGRYLMEHLAVSPFPRLIVRPPAGTSRFQEEAVCERTPEDHLPEPTPGVGFRTVHGLRRKPGVKNDLFGFAIRPAVRRQHDLLNCSINAVVPAEPDTDSATDAVRALLGMAGATRPGRVYNVFVLAEQSPNRESRVFLGRELDALGQRKTVVDFRLRDQDLQSIRVSLDLFARAIGESGHGRLQVRDSELVVAAGGGHDVGATRMADDPTARRHGSRRPRTRG